MTGIQRFKNFNGKISSAVEWLGMTAFVLMMLVTTIDVIGAKVLLKPMPGALDIMELLQLVAMAFALGASLIAGRHVQVEFVVPLLPKRWQHLADLIVNLLGLLLFGLLVWQMIVYGADLQKLGEVSGTVRLALYPFAYAAGIAAIPGFLVYLCFSLESITKVFSK